MKFHLIVAVDKKNGIGAGGSLPWKLKKDILFFKEITTSSNLLLTETEFGIKTEKNISPLDNAQSSIPEVSEELNAVIMGRITWESIPKRFRPLEGRYNYIVSRSWKPRVDETQAVFDSFEAVLEDTKKRGFGNLFVIGGESLYSTGAAHPDCGRIYLTQIRDEFNCDKFFPDLPADFKLRGRSENFREQNISFRFEVYERS